MSAKTSLYPSLKQLLQKLETVPVDRVRDSTAPITGTWSPSKFLAEPTGWPLLAVLDDADVWRTLLQPTFRNRFPLRKLDVSDGSRTYRIDRLHFRIRIMSQTDALNACLGATDRTESDMFESSLVYIYVVRCRDIDQYRDGVRSALNKFTETMQYARAQWLVVFPLVPEDFFEFSTARRVHKKLFDRMKSDMSVKKERERFCNLDVSEAESATFHSDISSFLEKLSNCVAAGFQRKCGRYIELIKDANTLRSTEKWDYNEFFLLKTGLAEMFLQFRLDNEALKLYDELEILQDGEFGIKTARNLSTSKIDPTLQPGEASILESSEISTTHETSVSLNDSNVDTSDITISIKSDNSAVSSSDTIAAADHNLR
eukprot:534482_1